MKAELVGKRSVRITMTLKQSRVLLEAFDSLEDMLGHTESDSYLDVVEVGEKMGVAIEIAKARGES